MHLRSGKEPLSPQYLTVLFLAQMAADLLALGLAIALLRFAAGATAADLGWKPEKLRSDAKLGLLALVAVIGPVLALQVALMGLVKWTGIDYAPDPIPLFLSGAGASACSIIARTASPRRWCCTWRSTRRRSCCTSRDSVRRGVCRRE